MVTWTRLSIALYVHCLSCYATVLRVSGINAIIKQNLYKNVQGKVDIYFCINLLRYIFFLFFWNVHIGSGAHLTSYSVVIVFMDF